MKSYLNIIFTALFLCTTVLAQTQQIGANKVVVGNKTAVDKTLEFNINQGAANPKIKANATTNKLQFAQDGVNFKDVGSGSGSGGSGINILTESGFESGINVGWTSSGGTYAAVTSGTNLLFGLTSASFQATATGQFFESTAIAIPVILQGQSCMAKVAYKGGDANLFLTVVDGASVNVTSNVVTTLSTQINKVDAKLYFTCPSSGSIKLRIQSTAASAAAFFDEAHLGAADFIQSRQSAFIGDVKYATFSVTTTSTSPTDLLAAPATQGAIYSGQVSQPTSNTSRIGVKLTNVKAGRYVITFNGIRIITASNATSNNTGTAYIGTDDLAICGGMGATGNTANNVDSLAIGQVTCDFTVTSDLTSKEFYLRGTTSNATVGSNFGFNAATGSYISVYYYPSGSDVVVNSKCPNDIACENIFTASLNGTGVMLSESLDFINGNCTNGSTGNYACTLNTGIFTVAPACTASVLGGAASLVKFTGQTNTTISYQVTQNGTLTNDGVVLTCQKQGADFKNRQNVQGFLSNTVTSSSNNERLVRGKITNCITSPCSIMSQSGEITSITRAAVGQYTVNFAAGTFSSAPTCMITCATAGVSVSGSCAFISLESTSGFTFNSNSNGSNYDGSQSFICMGPR